MQEMQVWSCVGKIPWRRKWQATPVFLPGESHGQKTLAGYSPWGRRTLGHDLGTKQQQRKAKIAILTWELEMLMFLTILEYSTWDFLCFFFSPPKKKFRTGLDGFHLRVWHIFILTSKKRSHLSIFFLWSLFHPQIASITLIIAVFTKWIWCARNHT